jgi:hypothetical protein
MKPIAFSSLKAPLTIVLVAAILVISANAQASRNPSASARRIEEFNKQSGQVARDEMNREMGRKKPSAEEMRKAKAIEAEIKEDLDALQTAYNDAVSKLHSSAEITESFVSGIAGRVHKHSERLKSNIKFPESKDEEPVPDENQSPTSIRKKLVTLCTNILTFFDSPMFESPNVLDIPKAQKARRALETVIHASSELKKVSK